jgi:protein-S-isoprenylcysteine O-methyltransferase Ste14
MICSGALIRWLSYRALGRFFTYELTIKEDHKLITTGPYAYVRHPGYSAILLVFFGTFLVFASPVSNPSWVAVLGSSRYHVVCFLTDYLFGFLLHRARGLGNLVLSRRGLGDRSWDWCR